MLLSWPKETMVATETVLDECKVIVKYNRTKDQRGVLTQEHVVAMNDKLKDTSTDPHNKG